MIWLLDKSIWWLENIIHFVDFVWHFGWNSIEFGDEINKTVGDFKNDFGDF
jgi:hypothetical protein